MSEPKNPFDFNDVSDLPEELQGRMQAHQSDNAHVYADVVRKGAEAGYPELNINQIMAAAIRMGIEVPTQDTVRSYLNKAVKMGLLSKPTRLTYGMGKVQAKTQNEDIGLTEVDPVVTQEVETTAAEIEPDAVETTDDPLASLGLSTS